jgi:hypothetical protein
MITWQAHPCPAHRAAFHQQSRRKVAVDEPRGAHSPFLEFIQAAHVQESIDSASTPDSERRTFFARLVLAGSFCATGGALLAFFLTGWSLVMFVGVFVGFAVAAWIVLLTYLKQETRAEIRRRLMAGLVAGFPAIAAYDLSRLGFVSLTGSDFSPFGTWPLFGQLLGARDPASAGAAGFVYHLANGLTFACAYAIAVPRGGILGGIAWALILETLMVSFYPGWLDLKALDEFIPVSLVGHLAYGAVLGLLAREVIARLQTRPAS